MLLLGSDMPGRTADDQPVVKGPDGGHGPAGELDLAAQRLCGDGAGEGHQALRPRRDRDVVSVQSAVARERRTDRGLDVQFQSVRRRGSRRVPAGRCRSHDCTMTTSTRPRLRRIIVVHRRRLCGVADVVGSGRGPRSAGSFVPDAGQRITGHASPAVREMPVNAMPQASRGGGRRNPCARRRCVRGFPRSTLPHHAGAAVRQVNFGW